MRRKPAIRTTRRILIFSVASVAGALAVASLAFACTPASGQTRWANTGSSANQNLDQGTRVTLNATGATDSAPYVLAVGTTDAGHNMNHTCMDVHGYINSITVYANSFGFIANTTGTIPNLPNGSYQVCFRDPDLLQNAYSTRAALLTII